MMILYASNFYIEFHTAFFSLGMYYFVVFSPFNTLLNCKNLLQITYFATFRRLMRCLFSLGCARLALHKFVRLPIPRFPYISFHCSFIYFLFPTIQYHRNCKFFMDYGAKVARYYIESQLSCRYFAFKHYCLSLSMAENSLLLYLSQTSIS